MKAASLKTPAEKKLRKPRYNSEPALVCVTKPDEVLSEGEMQDKIANKALEIASGALNTGGVQNSGEEMLTYAKVAETAVKIYKTIRGDAEADGAKTVKSIDQLVQELKIDASQTTINIQASSSEINDQIERIQKMVLENTETKGIA
jgi:hypothetical protein